ncbi:hypothetical protein VCHC56A2_2432, partial [Vibrio cholerae HC-56A2]
MRRLAK